MLTGPRVFPRIQHRLRLFYLFHHIQSAAGINFQGNQIVLKKKKKGAVVYNKQRWTANHVVDTVSSEKYWLHIKNK